MPYSEADRQVLCNIRHARTGPLRYCSGGLRRWFKVHNLDFLTFVRVGIPAGTLLDTHDDMARQVVDQALAGLNNG